MERGDRRLGLWKQRWEETEEKKVTNFPESKDQNFHVSHFLSDGHTSSCSFGEKTRNWFFFAFATKVSSLRSDIWDISAADTFFPRFVLAHQCKQYSNLPITVKLTKVFLVGASVKSTLHLYCPASTPITSSILKVAGNVSGRKWARAPSHFSSDQMTDVDKASEDVNTSSPPTSML